MIDYQEELEQYKERIDELATQKRYAELRDLFLPMEPADIALLLEEGKQEQMPLLYRLLPKETAAEVFVWTTPWTSWRRCPPAWSSVFWTRPRRKCASPSMKF